MIRDADHTRGIDHLVLAVRDLDASGRLYEALGFRVGRRNRHPWGTENRIVQFPGSFLELITVGEGAEIPEHGEGRFSFGAFVRDYLARREGFAMLVLDGRNGEADAALFRERGIGGFEPFRFERTGVAPDGSEAQVAFTLAFARDERAPGAGFFTCTQHFPENFWNPEAQRHPNGATGIGAVALTTPDPAGHAEFMGAFTGVAPRVAGDGAMTFELSRGHVDVMTSDNAATVYGSVAVDVRSAELAAFAVLVPEVSLTERSLLAAGVPFERIGSRAVVPASAAHGVSIAFASG